VLMSDKKKTNIAWLEGGYHRRRARLLQIRERFEGVEQADIDGEVSFEYMLQKLRDGGCFDTRRLVLVHAMPDFKGAKKKNIDKLIDRLSKLGSDCFVVFNGFDGSKEKSLFQYCKDNGRVYEYEVKLDRNQAKFYIEGRFSDMSLYADSGVAEAIVENSGFDPAINGINADLLEMAMTRLALYVAPVTKVTMEDVEATMYNFDNFVIWDMINALDARDYDRCLSMLHKSHLVSNSVSAAVTQMMTTLVWRYRLMLFLRESLDSGLSQAATLEKALSLAKLKKTGVGLSASFSIDPYKTGENAGKPQPIWNYHTVNTVLNGMYGRQPAIESWPRKDIWRLMKTLERVLLLLRESTDNESYLLADMVFMTACNKMSDSQVTQIIDSISRARDSK